MLTENDVVDAICLHLREHGYRVDGQCTTNQRGEDIAATHLLTGRPLLVEAKGGTSSKSSTNRFGKPFTPGQAGSHVAVALLKAAQLQQANPQAKVALALPDDADHRRLVAGIGLALSKLEIAVFLVADNRQVRLLGTLG